MVLNRIEQREREAAEQRRIAELQRKKDELAKRQAALVHQQAENQKHQKQLQQQAETRRIEEARRQIVRTNNNLVLGSSGVLQGLQDIERGRLTGTVRKHELVIDLDSGTAQLVWGNKFTVENNKVSNARRFISGLEEADYQTIIVKVNPDTMDLSVQGADKSKFNQNDWKNYPDKVLDALADAYFNPKRVTYREEPPSSSYSSSSSGYSGGQAEC